ncbi:unnamed protein product [Cyprideis torosa]|uniref:Uncharacterized protein n=1 Tax=Cyprideis torosa TaxID=163714 RepID=A0A7R8WJ23_9CRUS|nr:unnamed protein product [Cyprideis torosa]CAG0901392.1 unnamed protein product [Cyprideis torosa]
MLRDKTAWLDQPSILCSFVTNATETIPLVTLLSTYSCLPELGAKLSGAEEVLKSRQTEEARVMASVNELKNEIRSLEKRLKQTSSSLKDDEAALKKREAESGSQGEVFRQLKERCEQDEAALEVARQRLKAVSSGQFLADDGSNASLQEQLMGIKESLAQGDTAQKKRETELRHDRDELKRFRAEVAKSTGDASRDQNAVQRLRADVAKLTADMNRLNYEDGSYERVDAELQGIHGELNRIQRLLNEVQRRNPQLQFHYTDPQPNWDKRRVRGVLANLFTIKDPKAGSFLLRVLASLTAFLNGDVSGDVGLCLEKLVEASLQNDLTVGHQGFEDDEVEEQGSTGHHEKDVVNCPRGDRANVEGEEASEQKGDGERFVSEFSLRQGNDTYIVGVGLKVIS